MVDNIRSTGAPNIIVVPGAENGQDEKVLLAKAGTLLQNRSNLVFDLHAYDKWLREPTASVESRVIALRRANLPILFGEVGPYNAGILMNPTNFLTALERTGNPVLAWLWKYDGMDKNALLNANGTPNDNGNNTWGTLFRTFCLRPRNVLPLTTRAGSSLSSGSVFPIPATTELILRYEVKQPVEVRLCNALGQEVKRQKYLTGRVLRLSVRDVAPGAYFLRVGTEQPMRVLIQR